MVEKARNLKTYSAKKSEYGESGKYITITSGDGDHPTVTLNEEAIKKRQRPCRIQYACYF